MRFAFTHTALALCMMVIVYAITRNLLAAAMFPTAYYYGREMAQFQHALAKKRKVHRSSLWYRGWWPLEWGVSSALQFIVPASVCLILSYCLGFCLPS